MCLLFEHVKPDQYGIFGASADIPEQENSDNRYVGLYYINIILADCGDQILPGFNRTKAIKEASSVGLCCFRHKNTTVVCNTVSFYCWFCHYWYNQLSVATDTLSSVVILWQPHYEIIFLSLWEHTTLFPKCYVAMPRQLIPLWFRPQWRCLYSVVNMFSHNM